MTQVQCWTIELSLEFTRSQEKENCCVDLPYNKLISMYCKVTENIMNSQQFKCLFHPFDHMSESEPNILVERMSVPDNRRQVIELIELQSGCQATAKLAVIFKTAFDWRDRPNAEPPTPKIGLVRGLERDAALSVGIYNIESAADAGN